MGSHRVRHDWATSFSLFTFMHWRRKWQPTPVFLPGESQGWGSSLWWAALYGVAQSWTWLKWLSSSSSSKGDVAVVGCRFFISFFLQIYESAHPYTCRDWILWFKIVLAIKCKSCDLKFPFITGDIEFVCVCVCVCVCVYLWMDDVHPHGGKPSALLRLPTGM